MLRKAIVVLVLASALSGCLGTNGLSSKVLKFNLTEAEGRWTRELLYLGMMVIPVYPVCAILDMAIFNSIEFWAGTNPINGKNALVDIPKSEVDKLGLDGIDLVQIERVSETFAYLYVEFENGDRVTFDVVRDDATYTISHAGIEFFTGQLTL